MKKLIRVMLALSFLFATVSMADPPTVPTPSPEPDQTELVEDEIADAVLLYRGGRGGWFGKRHRVGDVAEQDFMALMSPSEYRGLEKLTEGEADELAYLRQRTMRRWGWKRWGATESVESFDVALMERRWGRITRWLRKRA